MKLMLAGKAPDDLSKLRYPLLASPKLDGIRAYVGPDGVVYSRSNKPIPNAQAQKLFGKRRFAGLDGELIVGNPTAPDVFRQTTSVVMAEASTHCALHFVVFDYIGPGPYYKRLDRVQQKDFSVDKNYLQSIPSRLINNVEQLEVYEQLILNKGFEGVMLRAFDGLYKYGRSTTREGGLLKLKRFDHGTFIVLGLEEQLRNDNAKGEDGKRTSHKAGKVGKNTLGALHVRDVDTGVEFDLGTGWTDAEREALWYEGTYVIGRRGRYKFFPTGSKEKPRFPTFDCWL